MSWMWRFSFCGFVFRQNCMCAMTFKKKRCWETEHKTCVVCVCVLCVFCCLPYLSSGCPFFIWTNLLLWCTFRCDIFHPSPLPYIKPPLRSFHSYDMGGFGKERGTLSLRLIFHMLTQNYIIRLKLHLAVCWGRVTSTYVSVGTCIFHCLNFSSDNPLPWGILGILQKS